MKNSYGLRTLLVTIFALCASQETIFCAARPATPEAKNADVNRLAEATARLSLEDRHALGKELLMAALNGSFAELKGCLDKGAEVDYAGDDGQTALFWAILNRFCTTSNRILYTPDYHSCIKELIKRGARLDMINPSRGDWGKTPLITVATIGDVRFTKMLIAAGADVNFCDNNECSPLERTAESAAHFQGYDAKQASLLNGQTVTGLVENRKACIALLLEAGADPMVVLDKEGVSDNVKKLIKECMKDYFAKRAKKHKKPAGAHSDAHSAVAPAAPAAPTPAAAAAAKKTSQKSTFCCRRLCRRDKDA